MFRREIEGVVYRFERAGLWGSGNTVTERELLWTGENTVYTMWDGHGIYGPRYGEYIEQYPALWGVLTLEDFLGRYATEAGLDCKIWGGEEVLGEGCDEACARVTEICGPTGQSECDRFCGGWTRSITDCLSHMDSCDPQACL